jgi:hypothetical protein
MTTKTRLSAGAGTAATLAVTARTRAPPREPHVTSYRGLVLALLLLLPGSAAPETIEVSDNHGGSVAA